MANLSSNSFRVQKVIGELDLATGANNSIECRVATTQTTSLYPGNAVNLSDETGGRGVPAVVKATRPDQIFGIVVRNQKDPEFKAGSQLVVARPGSSINLYAEQSIEAGDQITIDIGNTEPGAVLPSVGLSIGQAINSASHGELVRVILEFGLVNIETITTRRGRLVSQGLVHYVEASGAIAAGSAVSLVDGTEDIPLVETIAAIGNNVLGYAINDGRGDFADGERFMVAGRGSRIWLRTGAAVTRGAIVGANATNEERVNPASSGRTRIGVALTKQASINGAVLIELFTPSGETA